jgi:predicted PurR-regulated permease PerM
VFTTAHTWAQAILQEVLPSLEGIESSEIGGHLSSLVGGGLQASMIFILTIFFLLRFQTYMDAFLKLVPARHRDGVSTVAAELGWAVGGYLRGQLFIAFVVGVLTYIGLVLIGVPLARALGLLAGVLNVIPFFGPILVAIPTAMVALTIGWPHALGALGILVVVNQIDGQVLSPIVFAHTVEIDPATIVLAIFLGTVLFGLVGAILAVPAAVMVRFFVRRAYFESRWYRGVEEPVEAEAG